MRNILNMEDIFNKRLCYLPFLIHVAFIIIIFEVLYDFHGAIIRKRETLKDMKTF